MASVGNISGELTEEVDGSADQHLLAVIDGGEVSEVLTIGTRDGQERMASWLCRERMIERTSYPCSRERTLSLLHKNG